MELIKFFAFTAVFVGLCVLGFKLHLNYTRKKRLDEIKKREDRLIEEKILHCDLSRLSDHSNPELLACMIASKIKELLDLKISPAAMYDIMKKWHLLKNIGEPTNDAEILLLAKIKKAMREMIDGDNIIHWNHQTSYDNTKENWKRLNETVLSECPRSMLHWVPQYNN